jgi:hypothetical protein
MAFYPVDLIVEASELRLKRALRRWREGQVLEEPAFLNHYTGQLNANPFCRLGLAGEVAIALQVAVLHRKGSHLIYGSPLADRYGSDLAITIVLTPRPGIPLNPATKTIFIQFKRADERGIAILDRSQCNEARHIDAIYNRTYVALIDPLRPSIALRPLSAVEPVWTPRQKQATIRSAGFSDSSAFFEGILLCTEGLRSSPKFGVERLLASYVAPLPLSLSWLSDDNGQYFAADPQADLPPEIAPARAWVISDITA